MARHTDLYGNPHTTSHLAGIEAARAVEAARRQVARAIDGDARRVVFTSGATEANNLALFGVARAASTRRRIVTVRTEHSSVLEPVQALGKEGFEIEQLPVQADGLLDLDAVERAVDERTLLVSVMHVNNETGTIQPVPEIAAICRRVGAFLHSDCAQSLGRLSFDVRQHGADLLTLSAHKCYGPKGIGGLYVGSRVRRHIKPITLGGGSGGRPSPGHAPGAPVHRLRGSLPRRGSRRVQRRLAHGQSSQGVARHHPRDIPRSPAQWIAPQPCPRCLQCALPLGERRRITRYVRRYTGFVGLRVRIHSLGAVTGVDGPRLVPGRGRPLASVLCGAFHD